jgi:hypothetical protein
MKFTMGIEPITFGLVAQCLNQLRHRVLHTAFTDWFYNRDGVGLRRGTDSIFIYNSGYVFRVDLRTNSDYFPLQH